MNASVSAFAEAYEPGEGAERAKQFLGAIAKFFQPAAKHLKN